MIIEEKAKTNEPGWTNASLVERQDEAHWPDDVRRHGPKDLAFHQRFAHKAEFIMLEITKATMDELGCAGRCAGGEIVHFGQCHGISTARRIARNAAAVDSTTDHENIANFLPRHVFTP